MNIVCIILATLFAFGSAIMAFEAGHVAGERLAKGDHRFYQARIRRLLRGAGIFFTLSLILCNIIGHVWNNDAVFLSSIIALLVHSALFELNKRITAYRLRKRHRQAT